MRKRIAILFFIAAVLFCGCHKDVPVGRIERPDSLFYLKKSVELRETGETVNAEIYFFTFLRLYDFKDEEIYHPETVNEERYASLLEEIPKELREKYSLTPSLLKAIHAGEKTGKTAPEKSQEAAFQPPRLKEESPAEGKPVSEPEKREKDPNKLPAAVKATVIPPEAETAPVTETPISPEIMSPAPDFQKGKTPAEERPARHRTGRFQRLSIQRAADKEILFKTTAPLSVKEVMEAFGLASRPENVSQAPEGFRVKLPFSAQHLGGIVGKKEQGPYVADRGGETLEQVIANVKELVPELCGKRAYRCSIFEKLYAKGKIADSYSEAWKKIYLWNKDILMDYPFEKLIEGKIKIKGGTRLQIFTDFYYGDIH